MELQNETASEQPVDALADYRKQAKAELEEKKQRGKMSEAARQKLKANNEATKADKQTNENFAAQFTQLPKDVWTLVQLLKRIFWSDQNAWTTKVTYDNEGSVLAVEPVRKPPQMSDKLLERMADKIRWSLQHGWTATSVSDVVFFGTLTADEERMTDEKFIAHLEATAAKKPLPLSSLKNPALPVVGDVDLNGLDSATANEVWETGLDAWLEDETVTPKVAPTKTKAPYWNETRCRKGGLCKAGSLCLKASNAGKPAPVALGKQYCGVNCQDTYPIRRQKQQIRALAV
jgi:hypothetical protein